MSSLRKRLAKESQKKRRGSTTGTRVDLSKTPYPKTIGSALGLNKKKTVKKKK